MDILDLLLTPIYLCIFYLLARYTIGKNGENPLYGAYYMLGLGAKFFSTIFFALIYIYYYKGGDSLAFYYATSPLYKLFFSNTDVFFRFITGLQPFYPIECLPEADSHGVMYLVRGSATITTIRIASIINLLCFNSYIILCIAFAYISYLFQWRCFMLVSNIYPSLHKQLSWAFLFIPSVLFWGSGVGKDSIMLGSILFLFYCFYHVAIYRVRIVKYLTLLIITAYVISLIRGFILYAMVPCFMLMLITYYQNSIRSTVIRILVGPAMLVSGAIVSFLFVQSLGSSVESYSMDSLQQKAEGFKSWHSYLGETQGGSSYSLGEDLEYTPTGILKQAPVAVIITLYGPFIWQARNPVVLLSAIESIVFLFLTLRVLLNKRIYKLIGILVKDHIVVFCLPLIIILAIAVGLTSFNYGALVRYRIPILPFFGLLLVVTNYYFSGQNNPSNPNQQQ